MDNIKQELVETKFAIGAVVRHRFLDFRGVIFDVDPEFSNTEEWYQSIPASIRPRKNQPFYHLFAENGHIFYVAYVSEQNLLRISGITVRMQLHGDATVGLFQVAVRDVSVNAQDFVIISLCHALPLTACPTTPIGVASYAVHDFA